MTELYAPDWWQNEFKYKIPGVSDHPTDLGEAVSQDVWYRVESVIEEGVWPALERMVSSVVHDELVGVVEVEPQ
jgi:hypothetical protein